MVKPKPPHLRGQTHKKGSQLDWETFPGACNPSDVSFTSNNKFEQKRIFYEDLAVKDEEQTNGSKDYASEILFDKLHTQNSFKPDILASLEPLDRLKEIVLDALQREKK